MTVTVAQRTHSLPTLAARVNTTPHVEYSQAAKLGDKAAAARPGPPPPLLHYRSASLKQLGSDLASCIARSQSSAAPLPRHPRWRPGSADGRAPWTRCLAGTPFAALRVQTCLGLPAPCARGDSFFGPVVAVGGGHPRLRSLAAALSLCRLQGGAGAPDAQPPSTAAPAAAQLRRHSTASALLSLPFFGKAAARPRSAAAPPPPLPPARHAAPPSLQPAPSPAGGLQPGPPAAATTTINVNALRSVLHRRFSLPERQLQADAPPSAKTRRS